MMLSLTLSVLSIFLTLHNPSKYIVPGSYPRGPPTLLSISSTLLRDPGLGHHSCPAIGPNIGLSAGEFLTMIQCIIIYVGSTDP